MKIIFNRTEISSAVTPLMCAVSGKSTLSTIEGILIEAKFPKLNGKVLINNIGTTIGSHTGPGTVALFFWGDERVD